MEIIKENYRSIDLFLETTKERLVNPVFSSTQYNKLASQCEKQPNSHFYTTHSYSEAEKTMQNGYLEPLDKLKRGVLKIGSTELDKRPRLKNDFIGFIPHVPNTLMNIPTTMINKERQPKKDKNIHLLYSYAVLRDVSADRMIKGGINFLSLVNSLEKQGYRVKIDSIMTTKTIKTISTVLINLKEYGQNLNILKLAFPLVHPDMLRRISFKWLETLPNLTDTKYQRGYGTTIGAQYDNNGRKELELLKKHNILKGNNIYYCNAYEAMRANSVEELGNIIGLS